MDTRLNAEKAGWQAGLNAGSNYSSVTKVGVVMNLSGVELVRKFRAGEAYMARGWKTFVLGWEKRPIANCEACRPENAGYGHDAEACECLTCHGFYAGTLDRERLWAMLHQEPDGMLAVRTGRASGLLVLDAESAEKSGDGQEAGVDVLDNFELWSGGLELPATLRQRTGSGGLHLLYELPDEMAVSSRRILPNVDLKADGGYIAVPPGGDGRSWLNWSQLGGTVVRPADELLAWLKARKGLPAGNSSGKSTGAVLAYRSADRIPAGMRYEFTQKITYMIRKQSAEHHYTLGDALSICRTYWERYEQPDGDFYPFARVEYEMNRAWHRVEPAEPMDARLAAWMERKRQGEQA